MLSPSLQLDDVPFGIPGVRQLYVAHPRDRCRSDTAKGLAAMSDDAVESDGHVENLEGNVTITSAVGRRRRLANHVVVGE